MYDQFCHVKDLTTKIAKSFFKNNRNVILLEC